MSDFSNRTFTPDEVAKLKLVVQQGVKIKQEVETLSDGLKETVKHHAELLDVKPKIINAAIRAALKRDLEEKKQDINDLEDFLATIGL